MNTQLVLPRNFADYAWEVEAKGVLFGAYLSRGDRHIDVTFYEPVRLAQDVEEDVRLDGSTALSRVIIVRAVTPELMSDAVSRLPDSFFE